MDVYYDSLTFKDKFGTDIWSLTGKFSNELTNGMIMAACVGLIKANNFDGEYFVVHSVQPVQGRWDFLIQTEPSELLSNLIEAADLSAATRSRKNTIKDYVRDDSYYVWLYNGIRDHCDLVKFRTPEFIQGVLTMCNAFRLPYQDVILACPLSDGIYYRIQGVRLPLLPEKHGKRFIHSEDLEGIQFPEIKFIEPKYLKKARKQTKKMRKRANTQ